MRTLLLAVGVALALGLLLGVALEPDDGTPVQRSELDLKSAAAGANHAKPLPRPVSVPQLAMTAILAVGAARALVADRRPVDRPDAGGRAWSFGVDRPFSVARRRGPPRPA